MMVDMTDLKAKMMSKKTKKSDMRKGCYKKGGAIKVEGENAKPRADRRARGGSVGKKGTTVNIMVAPSNKPEGVPPILGQAPMPAGAPMPPPAVPPAAGGGMPMPPGAGMPPGGLPPHPGLKRGGRATDKTMTAGAGSGEGRLEKAKAAHIKTR